MATATQSPYDFNPIKVSIYKDLPTEQVRTALLDAIAAKVGAIDLRGYDKYSNDAQALRSELKSRGEVV